MERKAFLDQEPPPGYVAGVGRGATGFVTAADLGGIRNGRPFENLDESDNDVADNDNEAGILGSKTSKEDEEADRVYEEIENRLKKRTKSTKEVEVVENNELETKFSDLKQDLATISSDVWANLPEAADFTKRNKRQRLLEQQSRRMYATPDNIIASQSLNNYNALETEEGAEVDNEMADIAKNRPILASLRKSDPNRPASWIASARLEVQAKNFSAARRIISEGCRKIPHNEDVWLENVKIHQNSGEGSKLAKVVVTEGLKYNTKSENLWLKACECENSSDVVSQRRVLMKGIEFIPDSTKLWEKMIDLQDDPEDVKKILLKVVELCPKEWKFWLSLINLSEYSEAKTIVNRARKAMKDNHQVWITAVKLEEREKPNISEEKLIKMLEKGIKQVDENSIEGTKLLRNDWLDEAAQAFTEGFPLTSKAIVFNTINIGIDSDSDDKLSSYLAAAKYLSSKDADGTVNFVYEYITSQYPKDLSVWMRFFAAFKSSAGFSLGELYQYYEKSISQNQDTAVLRLMYAKDQWKLGKDIDGARTILDTALVDLAGEEDVWHAKIKFEVKNGNIEEANKVADEMVSQIPDVSSRVWYKYIHFKRFYLIQSKSSNSEEILSKLEDALERFPEEEKLHLQKAQILLYDLDRVKDAEEALSVSINKLPHSSEIPILLSRLYEDKLKIVIRSRAILDAALLKNPESISLIVEKISLERRNKDLVAARQLCNKSLRSFNKSPEMWIQYLILIPKMSQRKNVFLDALNATGNSSIILLNIGIFFWIEGKVPKAKSWFERAIQNDTHNGDIWGWLYNSYKQMGNKDEVDAFITRFKECEEDINRGKTWNQVAKDVVNYTKDPEEILDLVSNKLKTDTKL